MTKGPTLTLDGLIWIGPDGYEWAHRDCLAEYFTVDGDAFCFVVSTEQLPGSPGFVFGDEGYIVEFDDGRTVEMLDGMAMWLNENFVEGDELYMGVQACSAG